MTKYIDADVFNETLKELEASVKPSEAALSDNPYLRQSWEATTLAILIVRKAVEVSAVEVAE